MKKIILAVALLMAGSAEAALINYEMTVEEVTNIARYPIETKVGDNIGLSIEYDVMEKMSFDLEFAQDSNFYTDTAYFYESGGHLTVDAHPFFESTITNFNMTSFVFNHDLSSVAMSLSYWFPNGEGSWLPLFVHASGDRTAPVPEPSTMLLFGSGLVGLASISRRRKRTE